MNCVTTLCSSITLKDRSLLNLKLLVCLLLWSGYVASLLLATIILLFYQNVYLLIFISIVSLIAFIASLHKFLYF